MEILETLPTWNGIRTPTIKFCRVFATMYVKRKGLLAQKVYHIQTKKQKVFFYCHPKYIPNSLKTNGNNYFLGIDPE